MDHTLANLLLVLFIAWVSGAVVKRFGYPAILGELAAGIIFGPALLGILEESEGLKVLGEVGVFLMMLYIGMEVDYRALAKSSSSGFLVAVGSFIFPFIFGYFLTLHYGYPKVAALFVGLGMGVTALVAKSRIVVDLNLLGTRIGNVLFSASLIADALVLVIFSVVQSIHLSASPDVFSALFVTIGKALLFFGGTIFIGIKLFPALGKMMRRFGFTERTTNFTLVIMIGFVFAELAHLAGLHAILGAFLAGLFLSEEVLQRKLSHEVSTLVHDLSIGFLAPVFFVTVGFHVDLSVIYRRPDFLFWCFVLATIGKIFGTAIFYVFSRNGFREGMVIGAGMNGRGVVEIIIAQIALDAGIISKDIFSIMVFMSFLTTLCTPAMLKWGVDYLRRHGLTSGLDDARKGILILGATPLARFWARRFRTAEPLSMIDTNEQRCNLAETEGFQVYKGSGLDEDVLKLAGAQHARQFLAFTPNREVNLLSAQNAAEVFGVPEVFLMESGERLNSSRPRVKGNIFGLTFDIDGWNRAISTQQISIQNFVVSKVQSLSDFIKGLGVEEEVLPFAVMRSGKVLPSGAVTSLNLGDQVEVITRTAQGKTGREDHFHSFVVNAPILDFADDLDMDAFFSRISDVFSQRIGVPAQILKKTFTKREKESSTVIVPGLAIPHIVVEGRGKADLIIARCQKGISLWESPDSAHVIFCLVGTKDERNNHLKIISGIAQIFQDPTFEERWKVAKSEEELRQIILATDRRRF